MVMIDVDLHDDVLRIHFSPVDVVLGLVHDLEVPLADIVSAGTLRDPWRAVRGLRTGSGLRGVWLLGSWWRPGHRQLVALRRDQLALRVRLRSDRYDELLLSTPHRDLVLDRLLRRGVLTAV